MRHEQKEDTRGRTMGSSTDSPTAATHEVGETTVPPNAEPRGVPSIEVYLRQVVAANGSQKETARVLCISPQYLCDILKGRRDISAELADLLGYQRVVTYLPKP